MSYSMTMLIRLLFCLFPAAACLTAFAQKEASIWYFGNNAGLDFTSGSPVALNDGALNTPEGCAAISDSSGHLLFYTDGVTIWNRNHVPMPNGTGLMGFASSTQNALIIPHPGDPDLYYVFTADGLSTALNHHMENGYRYSVVDMSLDGGLGDVTAGKNILLYAPSTEKLAAVKHADGTSVWLMTHEWNSSRFVAYKINCNGLDPTPVYSDVGVRHEVFNGGAVMLYQDAIGQMKFSPDGKRLAVAVLGQIRVQVMDFDAATGLVSNPINILSYYIDGYLQPDGGVVDFEYIYGVEFSPNGKLLYLTKIDYGDLYQYDLDPGTSTGISATAKIYYMGPWCNPVAGGFTCPASNGGLQLGPDGKIYMAYKTFSGLNVIADPNVYGPGCNYIQSPALINTSQYGLPSFIASYFYQGPGVQHDHIELTDEGCGSIKARYSAPLSGTWSWSFGETGSATNFSGEEFPAHTYDLPGKYTVTITLSNASGCTKTLSEQIEVEPCPIHFPNVFSPNGDGTHDVLIINGIENYPDNQVVIYNRWGNEVFRQAGYNSENAFTGAGCAEGVYYYTVDISNGLRHHGSVTIVR